MKKVVIVFGVIVVILVVIFGGGFIYGYTQALKINKEIDYFNENGKINEEIVTKGEFKKIEKLVEADLILYKETTEGIISIYETEGFENILTAENYEKDGPNFTKSNEMLHLMRYELGERLQTLDTIILPDEISRRMNEENLDESYYDVYETYLSTLEYKKSIDEIFEENEKVYDKINKALNILEYLTKNKSKWSIKKKEIISSNDKFLTEYNTLINEYNNIYY